MNNIDKGTEKLKTLLEIVSKMTVEEYAFLYEASQERGFVEFYNGEIHKINPLS